MVIFTKQPKKARKNDIVLAQKARMWGFCCTVPQTLKSGSSVAFLLESTASLYSMVLQSGMTVLSFLEAKARAPITCASKCQGLRLRLMRRRFRLSSCSGPCLLMASCSFNTRKCRTPFARLLYPGPDVPDVNQHSPLPSGAQLLITL